jgi:glucose/arabinose dehydrogenase
MTHRLVSSIAWWCCACSGGSLVGAADGSVDAYLADPKLKVTVYAEQLAAARQLAFAANGDLFVNNGKVTVLWDADHDGVSRDNERAVFGEASHLNHGLSFDRDQHYLYASSDSAVYRFAYSKGQRAARGAAQLVVRDIPTGGHSTRTLLFDVQNRLLVSVGSDSNVDTAESDLQLRSQIRRFAIPDKLPKEGLAYSGGTVVASGMRNEVGLFIDGDQRMWGVENGRDNLSDDELGGDIHTDNPGEEINVIDGSGSAFYGYPFCFSEFSAPKGSGAGSAWADDTLPKELRKTDAYCRDPKQVHPPAGVMPAHWAPLGIIRYAGSQLPYRGDLLIAAHGSWNRQPAVGRLLARAHVDHGAVVSVTPLFAERTASGGYNQGRWGVRPVDVREAADGSVYVSDDMGGRIFRLTYAPSVR